LGRMPGGSLLITSYFVSLLFPSAALHASENICPPQSFEKIVEDKKNKTTTKSCFKGDRTRAVLHGPHLNFDLKGQLKQQFFYWEGTKVSKREFLQRVSTDKTSNKSEEEGKQKLQHRRENSEDWKKVELYFDKNELLEIAPEFKIQRWSVSPEDQEFASIEFKDSAKLLLKGKKIGAFHMVGYDSNGMPKIRLAISVAIKRPKSTRFLDSALVIELETFKKQKSIPISAEISIVAPYAIGVKSGLDSNYNCSIRLIPEDKKIILLGLKYGENRLFIYDDQNKLADTINFTIK
jgi:hypothetical protein